MHLQAFLFRDGPPWAAESGTIGTDGLGRYWWRGFSRVHDPVVWTGGYFPGLNPSCLRRREYIIMRDRQFGGRVREVVPSNIGVRPYFMEGGA